MIDASSFAMHHNAFWSDLAPTSEHFVRRLNLQHTERSERPLPKPDGQFRAALVAELAFVRYCYSSQSESSAASEGEALEEARRNLTPLLADPQSLEAPLSADEILQTSAIQERLRNFFAPRGTPLIARPKFKGCGFVDSSEGDVICGCTLYEIKAVDRRFRSIDIRQLLTYCALNYSSKEYTLEKVGIYNPRRGTYIEMDTSRICRSISGASDIEIFDSITHAFSSGELSQ